MAYPYLMLAIKPNGSSGLPISVVDTDTGREIGRFKTVIDAQKAVALLEGNVRNVEEPAVSLPPTVAW